MLVALVLFSVPLYAFLFELSGENELVSYDLPFLVKSDGGRGGERSVSVGSVFCSCMKRVFLQMRGFS